MATNKSKDAAALFELIDKSTLKVPKNAGALKIPSWWSSRTNPAAPGASGPAAGQTGGPTGGGAGRTNGANGQTAEGANGHAVQGHRGYNGQALARAEVAAPQTPAAGELPANTPAQQRLFQPPPPGETPAVTPSIRPPARPTAMGGSASVAAPAPAPPVGEPVAPPKSTEAIPEEELRSVPEALTNKPASARAAGLPPAPPGGPARAPTGAAPSASLRAWPRKERSFFSQFSQVPRPALIGGAAAAVLILLIILFFAFRHPRTSAAKAVGGADSSVEAPIEAPGRSTTPDSGGIPVGNGGAQQTSGDTGARGGGLLPANPAGGGVPTGNASAARVYEPNTYHYQPDKLYVFIASDSSEPNVRRNAQFFADHGISVAIERSKNYFVLIATEPLASNVAAEPFLKKIHEVAKLHWDYKSNHRVFADAVPRRVVIGSSEKDSGGK
ncbi:MAG TPA: hypothetical protein VH253_18975 [Phycisphaerae bacterium]|nr:hypothetical protein [Phycisphaerae bacterium]